MEPFVPTGFCEVEGGRLALYEYGDGETAVLIHGIVAYSFAWRTVAPKLAMQRRMLAVDLLGCGASAMPLDCSYALRDHATRLAQLVDQLKLDRFHLVGHDVGGGVAQIFALRHPERLLSLSLLNPVGYDLWPVQPITAMRTPVLRQLAMAVLDLGALRAVVRRGLYHKDRLTPELMELFWAPLSTSAGRKAFLHFARCLDNRDITSVADGLPRLDLPVLLMRGDADRFLRADIVERLHRELPRNRLVRVATAGHLIQEDEPERVVTELSDFWGGLRD